MVATKIHSFLGYVDRFISDQTNQIRGAAQTPARADAPTASQSATLQVRGSQPALYNGQAQAMPSFPVYGQNGKPDGGNITLPGQHFDMRV